MADAIEPTIEISPAARVADGLGYLAFLTETHRIIDPEWYLEVGTSRGHSLTAASCKSVAIDPAFRINTEIVGKKPELYMFQEESDTAFASPRLKAIDPRFDLAFLDGMHLFEFLLRDVLNAERFMSKSGIMFLHDTAPFNSPMASREHVVGRPGGWTGDVWKVLPILAEARPDIQITHLNCRPTGLTMLRGPWSRRGGMTKAIEKLISKFMSMSIDEYRFERYYSEFPLQSPATVLEELRATFGK